MSLLYDPSTKSWYNYDPGKESTDEQGNPIAAVPSLTRQSTGVPDNPPQIGTHTPTTYITNPGSDPGSLAATILAAQFSNWQSQFQPVELAAMDELSFNNPNVLPTAVNKARTAAEGSYQGMSGVLERQNRSMGIQATPEQSAASGRLINLSQASAVAGAENTARANVRTQDEQILLGSSPNPNVAKPVSPA
jgi:hypothetical protein